MFRDPSRLVAALPVRFLDDLTIELDAGASGRRLTPKQGFALAERLIHQAARKQMVDRCARAARRKVTA